MLQIDIHELSTIKILELSGQALTVIGTLWRIIKQGLTRLKMELNSMITENVNRSIIEMKSYTDAKFTEHEESAFGRIENLERQISGLKINDTTKRANA